MAGCAEKQLFSVNSHQCWLYAPCRKNRRFRLRTPSSAVPDAIAQAAGYAVSQQKRKLIEQGFGWAKTVEPIRQVMVRGLERVDQLFVLTMAAYNLTRMRTLGQIRLLGREKSQRSGFGPY